MNTYSSKYLLKDLFFNDKMSTSTAKPVLSKFELLKLFKENLIKFFDSLIEQLPDESDLIIMRLFIENQIPIEEVMKTFSERVLPHKEMVYKKNEQFFIICEDMFMGLKTDKVSKFKSMWMSSKKLSKDDKETIWKWFNLFVRLSEEYVKHT